MASRSPPPTRAGSGGSPGSGGGGGRSHSNPAVALTRAGSLPGKLKNESYWLVLMTTAGWYFALILAKYEDIRPRVEGFDVSHFNNSGFFAFKGFGRLQEAITHAKAAALHYWSATETEAIAALAEHYETTRRSPYGRLPDFLKMFLMRPRNGLFKAALPILKRIIRNRTVENVGAAGTQLPDTAPASPTPSGEVTDLTRGEAGNPATPPTGTSAGNSAMVTPFTPEILNAMLAAVRAQAAVATTADGPGPVGATGAHSGLGESAGGVGLPPGAPHAPQLYEARYYEHLPPPPPLTPAPAVAPDLMTVVTAAVRQVLAEERAVERDSGGMRSVRQRRAERRRCRYGRACLDDDCHFAHY